MQTGISEIPWCNDTPESKLEATRGEGKTKELGWAGCDQKSKQQLRTSP